MRAWLNDAKSSDAYSIPFGRPHSRRYRVVSHIRMTAQTGLHTLSLTHPNATLPHLIQREGVLTQRRQQQRRQLLLAVTALHGDDDEALEEVVLQVGVRQLIQRPASL